jgi:thiol-disulfide isomerase/thioredoxin
MKPLFAPGLAVALAFLFLHHLPAQPAPEPDDAQPPIDPKAQALLRQSAEFYAGLKSFTAEATSALQMQMQGLKQEMRSEYSVAMQRPNRLAIVLNSGMMGATTVSDGNRLYSHIPMLQKYTEKNAPESLDELGQDEAALFGGAGSGLMFLHALLHRDPYSQLTKTVTKGEYTGEEKVNDLLCHRLKFEQEEMEWEMWIRAEGSPWIERVSIDMGKAAAQGAAAEQMPMLKDLKMVIEVRFNQWIANPEIPEDRFAFTPPEGVEKADSILGGLTGEGEPHALLGAPAPDFTLPLLEGGEMNLAAHKGKEIVILDFWATWCGPCVKALPILIEVADAYREKGVVFYAINQQEDPKTIRPFLEKRKLKLTVPLDRQGAVGGLYHVEGIPQTVIIDKQGIVQAVHVGLLPDLKTKLTQELDELLAGRDLKSGQPPAKATQTRDESSKGLDTAWTLQGRWTGVAAGGAGQGIYAVQASGSGIRLDGAGEKKGEFKLENRGTHLRLARLLGGDENQLIAFTAWGRMVAAHNADGTSLWTYPGGQGVNDVWAADLDGDGLDEVIIGYNGSTGLHVLDNRGKLLWKTTEIGNVWHVTARDPEGSGAPEVITTSAQGRVHVFDADGNKVRDIDPGFYANMVRAQGARVIAGGTAADSKVLAGFAEEGAKTWQIDLAERSEHIDAALGAPGKPWVAALLRGGGLVVVDTKKGAIIARGATSARRGEIAWAAVENGGAPLLVVATGRELRAYRVTE